MKVFHAHHGYKVQSIRSCPAMDDWLKMGWYILANRDLEVVCGMTEGDQEDQIEWKGFDPSDGHYHSASHPSSQMLESFEYISSDNDQVNDAFKFRQPWGIKTPKGYSCFFLDPFLFQNKHEYPLGVLIPQGCLNLKASFTWSLSLLIYSKLSSICDDG
jgi:hypothetical protein